MIQYRNCMKNMSHRLPVNILMTRWQEKYPPENVPGELIGLFTENPETITIGIAALHIISLGFILSAVSVTSSGALEALGQGMASLVISVMRYVAVIIPAAFVLSRLIGVTGVWWAFVCTESVTAMVAYVLYRKVWKRA